MNIINTIGDSLKSDSTVSSVRIVMYATIGSILLAFLMHNIRSVIGGHGFIDFPLNSIGVITAVVGGKVWQAIKGEK